MNLPFDQKKKNDIKFEYTQHDELLHKSNQMVINLYDRFGLFFGEMFRIEFNQLIWKVLNKLNQTMLKVDNHIIRFNNWNRKIKLVCVWGNRVSQHEQGDETIQ